MIILRACAFALAFLANAALADAPTVSLRPLARPAHFGLPKFTGPRPPARPVMVQASAAETAESTPVSSQEIIAAALSDALDAPEEAETEAPAGAPDPALDQAPAPDGPAPEAQDVADEAQDVAELPTQEAAPNEPRGAAAPAPARQSAPQAPEQEPLRAAAVRGREAQDAAATETEETATSELVAAALPDAPRQPASPPPARPASIGQAEANGPSLPDPQPLDAPRADLAPEHLPRAPMPRPGVSPPNRVTLEAMLAAAALGGEHSVAMIELEGGLRLVDLQADVQLPPASVTKAMTALYALEHLGPEMRFATRVAITGPIEDGIVQGDLALLGGGDPTLDSDDLAALVFRLKEAGLRGVTGRFLVWGGAMPYIAQISPAQMDHLAYNPALSGLNVNFNRAHFEWRRRNGRYDFRIEARSDGHVTPVSVLRMNTSERGAPVYQSDAVDSWTVARSALGQAGGRWMPVRRPAQYAGEVMRALAKEQGIVLPEPFGVMVEPQGNEVALHESAPLREILREMLYYSTNLTAEIVGLAASKADKQETLDIGQSAAAMSAWLSEHFGSDMHFHDHSGLDERNRASAAALTKLLSHPNARAHLRPVLKEMPIDDAPEYPGKVAAKTGTLNFVSTLAGYVEGADGTPMAFAILTGDLPRRAQAAGSELPQGAVEWNRRAKDLQEQFLRRWRLRIAPPPASD